MLDNRLNNHFAMLQNSSWTAKLRNRHAMAYPKNENVSKLCAIEKRTFLKSQLERWTRRPPLSRVPPIPPVMRLCTTLCWITAWTITLPCYKIEVERLNYGIDMQWLLRRMQWNAEKPDVDREKPTGTVGLRCDTIRTSTTQLLHQKTKMKTYHGCFN